MLFVSAYRDSCKASPRQLEAYWILQGTPQSEASEFRLRPPGAKQVTENMRISKKNSLVWAKT
jgi:hypothetical protein